ASTATGGGTAAPSAWSKSMNWIDTVSAFPMGTSASLLSPVASVGWTWGTPSSEYDVTTSFRVSPSMSPLIATRLVAADGIVVPVGHDVDGAGAVVTGTVVGAVVVGVSVAGTAVVVVVASIVVVTATAVVVGADDGAAVVF